MRKLSAGNEGSVNPVLTINVLDEPGQGGACHEYEVLINNQPGVPSVAKVSFQNGPINEDGNGVNGATNEALLAILIDRMEGFQSGKYACDENQFALDHLRNALDSLSRRTKRRIDRGVEGTHTV